MIGSRGHGRVLAHGHQCLRAPSCPRGAGVLAPGHQGNQGSSRLVKDNPVPRLGIGVDLIVEFGVQTVTLVTGFVTACNGNVTAASQAMWLRANIVTGVTAVHPPGYIYWWLSVEC